MNYLQSKLRAGKGTFGRIFSKKSLHHKSINENKNKNNHTDGTFPNSNRKINDGGKIDTPNTQIHNHSLSWLTKGISIKCGGVKLVSCAQSFRSINIKRVWRNQTGNQNPYIEEQTKQWSTEKVQKDKQRSTKHTYKTKDRVTRTPLRTGGELRCCGRVSSSCSTSDTHRINPVTNPVTSHERGKAGKCLRQVEHIRGHL